MLERMHGIDWPHDDAELARIDGIADRCGDLLVFANESASVAALELLASLGSDADRCELLRLPASPECRFERTSLYGDYAIASVGGRVYFDLSLVAVFALLATKPEAEPAPALLQLEEHLIGTLTLPDGPCHLIDRQLAPLADRVARAYGCATRWLA